MVNKYYADRIQNAPNSTHQFTIDRACLIDLQYVKLFYYSTAHISVILLI